MNKKTLLITMLILAAIVGSGVYIIATDSEDQDSGEMVNTLPIEDSTPTTNVAPGKYVDYSDSIVTSTAGTKLLFFHAPWCPQCRDLDTDIKHDGVPDGVTIIKIDYDTHQPLRKKYGVTLQTTFVKVDDSGNLIEKFVAYDDPTLDSVKENLL